MGLIIKSTIPAVVLKKKLNYKILSMSIIIFIILLLTTTMQKQQTKPQTMNITPVSFREETMWSPGKNALSLRTSANPSITKNQFNLIVNEFLVSLGSRVASGSINNTVQLANGSFCCIIRLNDIKPIEIVDHLKHKIRSQIMFL